jgi:hypothetical protein
MFLSSIFIEREASVRSFPFLFLLSLSSALMLSPPLRAQEIDSRVWEEALIYLTERGANTELDTLRAEALKHRPEDLILAEAFLENLVARKDRLQLTAYVQALGVANECKLRVTSSKTCTGLRSVWSERLKGLLFFESSAPRWEKARRALGSGDCRLAQAELKEIELREGVFPDLLEKKILVAQCLGEAETAATLGQELEKLRF